MYRRPLLALAPFAALALTAATPALKPGDALLIPRIHAHFDSVLVELRTADVRRLTTSQLERRATLVARLQRYRDRSVFPHNYDFPGQAIPYFVDRRTGTLCAVAHLLASTGRRDIVNRVAILNNNVWVAELAGDAQFEAWLAENGLTLAEAGRIQVPYMGPGPDPVIQPSSSRQSNFVPTAANLGVASITAANFLLNRDGHGKLRNWIGVASGVANVALGTSLIRNEQQSRLSGFVNVGLGTLSAAVSTRAMFRRHAELASRRDAGTKVAIAPVLPTSESGAGLSLSVRF
jgi:hypothetical protein